MSWTPPEEVWIVRGVYPDGHRSYLVVFGDEDEVARIATNWASDRLGGSQVSWFGIDCSVTELNG